MTKTQQQILDALRKNVEGTQSEIGSGTWGTVYIDNAKPDGMSRRAFAGHLSQLEQAGFYLPYGDDTFGKVLLEEAK